MFNVAAALLVEWYSAAFTLQPNNDAQEYLRFEQVLPV